MFPAIKRHAILMIFALAFLLRFWGAFEYKGQFMDEGIHVPSAISYGEFGVPETGDIIWTHPPLGHLTLYGTIKLFGDNAYGWRMRNIALGTLTVVFMFLVARQLFPGTRVPLLASTMLSVDPFHIFFSRSTFTEIPTACFFLMFLFFIIAYLQTGRDYHIPAGIFLGLTIATKSYYPLATICVISLVASQRRQRLTPLLHWAYLAATLLLIPSIVYLLTYLPWLKNGHSLSELIQMRVDAFVVLQSYTIDNFAKAADLLRAGSPWEWFVKPFSGGFSFVNDGVWGRFILEINSPPIRMITLPALGMSLWLARHERRWQLFVIPTIFVSTYILFLLIKRPMFSYSAVVLLPYAYLMIAFCLDAVLEKLKDNARLFKITITMIFMWGIYLFPLVSAREVPIWLYKPVLSSTRFLSLPEYGMATGKVGQ